MKKYFRKEEIFRGEGIFPRGRNYLHEVEIFLQEEFVSFSFDYWVEWVTRLPYIMAIIWNICIYIYIWNDFWMFLQGFYLHLRRFYMLPIWWDIYLPFAVVLACHIFSSAWFKPVTCFVYRRNSNIHTFHKLLGINIFQHCNWNLHVYRKISYIWSFVDIKRAQFITYILYIYILNQIGSNESHLHIT